MRRKSRAALTDRGPADWCSNRSLAAEEERREKKG